MGPRRRGRGNHLERENIEVAIVLQWGHGVEAMETLLAWAHPGVNIKELQWGHGVEAVETSGGHSISPVLLQASMGPRRRGRGNAP